LHEFVGVAAGGDAALRYQSGKIQSGARKMRKPARRVRPVDIEIRHGYLRGMNTFDGRSTNARIVSPVVV
jgi:hypothetical protein